MNIALIQTGEEIESERERDRGENGRENEGFA